MRDADLLPIRFVARQLRVPLKWLKGEAIAGRVPALDAGGVFLCDPNAVKLALLSRAVATPDNHNLKQEPALA